MTEYGYVIRRRGEPLDSLNENVDALSVDFSVHLVLDCVEVDGERIQDFEVEPTLSGMVDWQDGVHIWQSECIEPGDFISIMACAHEAVVAARKMIGANWDRGLSEPQPDPGAA